MTVSKLSDLQKAQVTRIVTVLGNMGCKFKITTPDGEVFAHKVEDKTSKRGPLKHPYGELRSYIRPYVENLNAGEVGYIPFDKYEALVVQSSAASFLTGLWGKGTYTTTIHRDKGYVEVLRTDGL